MAFWGGWISSFVLTLIGFHWVAHTAHEFGHIPWIISIPILFLFASLGNLHFAIAGWLWAWLANQYSPAQFKWLRFALLPLVILVGENYFPMIFPWNFGYTWFYLGWPLYQLAEWIGFSGISAWVLFSNLALFILLFRYRSGKSYWPWLAGFALLFVSLNLIGFYIEKRLPPPDREVGVLAIQANIGNLEKQYAEKGWGFRDYIISRYIQIAKQGFKEYPFDEIDFALWPETAFPDKIDPANLNSGLSRRLTYFLKSHSIALVTGAYSDVPQQGKTSNSLFSFNREGQLNSPPYHKTVLLAFGEYLPFGDQFPALKERLSMVADFARGHGPALVQQDQLQLGAQICYEGLFPQFSKKLAQLGAQAFINVTNDSWFGKKFEPHQHMFMTLARAIEFRRPVIRATNTGITTAITASGEILAKSPLHEEWYHLFKIPYNSKPKTTFYQEIGIYFIPALTWLLVIACLGGVFYRVRTRKN